MILAQRELLTLATSEVTVGRLEIERLKLMLAKARREQYGQSSERGRLLVEQLELAIEDLEETQAEQETRAEIAAPVAAKQKRAQNPRPPRRPLPDNLPVERIVEPAPCACGKCGSERLHKLGEVVSKTLECEPRCWKIIEHVREKFSCRDCEAITEAPAPSHPIPRGFAGAGHRYDPRGGVKVIPRRSRGAMAWRDLRHPVGCLGEYGGAPSPFKGEVFIRF